MAEVSLYVAQNVGVEVKPSVNAPSDYVAQNVGLETKAPATGSLYLEGNPGDWAAVKVDDQLGPEFAFAPRIDLLTPVFGRVGNVVRLDGLGLGDECVFIRWGQDDAYDATGAYAPGTAYASGSVNAVGSAWTLEVWFRSQRRGYVGTASGEATGSLVELCTSPSTRRFVLELTAGKIRARVVGGSTVTTTAAYDDGEWHNARLILSAGTMHLLVDGVLAGDLSPVATQTINLVRLAGTEAYARADMRETRLLPVGLEHLAYEPEWEYTAHGDEVGWWRCDDGSGATLADRSTYNNDLAITGDDFRWVDWDFNLRVRLNALVCGGPTEVRNTGCLFTIPVGAVSGQVRADHQRLHVDTSNSKTFTVLPEEPLRGVGVEVRVYDKDNFGSLLAILEDAFGVGFTVEHNQAGAGQVNLHASDPKAGVAVVYGNLFRVYYDGIERFAFVLENVDEGIVDEGDESAQVYTLTGRGPLSTLENALVYPPDWPVKEPLLTSYADKTAGHIVADQVAKAVARGALPNVTVDFTDDVDSMGAAWPETFTMDLEPGLTLASVLGQFVTMGYDAVMTSGLVLRLFVERGLDRTAGDDPTVFRQGYNLFSKTRRASSAEVKNVALVAAQTGLSEFVKASGGFGRRETFMDATDQEITTAGRAASLILDTLSVQDEGFTSQVASIVGASEVFEGFDVGDWVLVNVPGKLDLASYRVKAITLSVGDDDEAQWTVDFNSVRYEWGVRVKRMLDALSGGSLRGATGSGRLDPVNPTTGVDLPGEHTFYNPVTIRVDSDHAFLVETADGTDVFKVDTITPEAVISGHLVIDPAGVDKLRVDDGPGGSELLRLQTTGLFVQVPFIVQKDSTEAFSIRTAGDVVVAKIDTVGRAFSIVAAASGVEVLKTGVVGDAYGRASLVSDGSLRLGSGAASPDSILSRPAANFLKVEDTFGLAAANVTLANGDNHNVAIGDVSSARFIGPTAAFAVTGLVTKGVSGQLAIIWHTLAYPMTIKNDNAGSSAANRIYTQTGGDVTLVGPAAIALVYSAGLARWVLLTTWATGFGSLKIDAVNEATANAGVTVEGVKALDSFLEFTEVAAPATPAANKLRLYAKDKAGVSTLYYLKDDGTEVEMGGASTFLALTDTPGSYAGAGGKLVAVNVGATALEFIAPPGAASLAGVMIGRGQWGELTPGYQTNAVLRTGLYDGSTPATSGTVGRGEDADGYYASYTSGATQGSDAGVEFNVIPMHARRQNFKLLLKLKLASTADIRGFWGLSNGTLATMDGSDDPAGHYVGLQYSSPRGDANWQFVSKDNVTQNIVNSGVAVSTNAVYVRITANDSVPNVLVELLDATYAVVASNTFIANLPGQTTLMGPCVGLETRANPGAKTWQLYFLRGLNPNV